MIVIYNGWDQRSCCYYEVIVIIAINWFALVAIGPLRALQFWRQQDGRKVVEPALVSDGTTSQNASKEDYFWESCGDDERFVRSLDSACIVFKNAFTPIRVTI